jgi:hypothetical protein
LVDRQSVILLEDGLTGLNLVAALHVNFLDDPRHLRRKFRLLRGFALPLGERRLRVGPTGLSLGVYGGLAYEQGSNGKRGSGGMFKCRHDRSSSSD